MSRVVTLIGYRATGKSTVGPALARRLGWECVDSDLEVERRTGRTISQIFSEAGEPEFRRLERETIRELLTRDKLVLSTGGGAVLDEHTRHDIKTAGQVVWLQASVESILKRLAADADTDQRRPNLTDHADLRTEVTEVLKQRTSLYADAATIVIDTDDLDGDSVTEAVYRQVATEPGYGDQP